MNGTHHPYMFGGNEYDESLGINSYDFGSRNYDPALGRWFNIDPLAERRYEINPYNFVQNSPMFRIDPDGLTDYKLNKKTGEVTQVGEANDEPDRIVKTNRKGEVKTYKRGKRKGQAKVAIDNIEQGILKDGMNLKEDSNVIEVGGEGQATEQGVEAFALKLSEYVGKEIAGSYFSSKETGETTHISIGNYKNNTHKSASSSGIGALRDFVNSVEEFNAGIKGFFHTHPSGGGISDSDRLVPSDTDLNTRDNSLGINPMSRPEIALQFFSTCH